ncbi:MAG: tetratricopeptide repeat protein [Pontiellaceae bacterium]|nr:tetratricopeptide repeat protein [Pontiellaceae bacterium]
MKYIRSGGPKFYAATLLFFLLSLLSKPAAVVFPLVLLLIDYYENRTFNGRAVVDKIIFFLLALLFGIITFTIQKESAAVDLQSYTLFERVLFASYGFITYLWKMICPTGLAAFYPYPSPAGNANLPVIYYLSPLLVLILGFLIYKSISFTKVIFFGFAFYLATVVLVLQFITVGSAIIADRYTYVPFVGLFFMIGHTIDRIWYSKKLVSLKYRTPAVLLITLFSGWCIYLTRNQITVWENSETLWTNVINTFPPEENAVYVPGVAFKQRGIYYGIRNRTDEALADYEVLVNRNSKDPEIYSNLGNIYAFRKEYDKAFKSYAAAISLNTNKFSAYLNRGILYTVMKKHEAAIADYNEALRIDPSSIKAYQGRASSYFESGKYELALADLNYLIRKIPNDYNCFFLRGMCHFSIGNLDESLNDFQHTVRINPGYAPAFYNLSGVYLKLNDKPNALKNALKAKSLGHEISESYLNHLK